MNLRTDYSDVHFKDNGKLKLLIIVGTRPEIIRLAAVINKTRQYFDVILALRVRTMTTTSMAYSSTTSSLQTLRYIWMP